MKLVTSALLRASLIIAFASEASASPPQASSTSEPSSLEWLEQPNSPRVAEWVANHNAATARLLQSDPGFEARYQQGLREPRELLTQFYATYQGDWVFDYFQNAEHPRGLLRRVALTQLGRPTQNWETVLDIDALSQREGRSWSYQGITCSADGARCLIGLNQGNDPVHGHYREFDMRRRVFVDPGFSVSTPARPEWLDGNTILFVDTDASGTRGVMKIWRRGSTHAAAEVVFSPPTGSPTTYLAIPNRGAPPTLLFVQDQGGGSGLGGRVYWLFSPGAALQRLYLPERSSIYAKANGKMLLVLGAAITSHGIDYHAGDLVSVSLAEATRPDPTFDLMVSASTAIFDNVTFDQQGNALVSTFEGVEPRLWIFRPSGDGWTRSAIPMPEQGTVNLSFQDTNFLTGFVRIEGFGNPPSLYKLNAAAGTLEPVSQPNPGGERYITTVNWVASSDGVRVPYYLTGRADVMARGNAPTLMIPYGAYGFAQRSYYSHSTSALWLAEGGMLVIPGIRGGGEMGPSWHVTGANRRHTYEDLFAVASDLSRRGIAQPRQLGIFGFSAGGSLAAVALTQRPELFGAIVMVAGAPDFFRFDLTEAGEAGQALEWGSSQNPLERRFLEQTSPLQNLGALVGTVTPLIMTSTNDTRVNPAQSRRFAFRMEELNLPFLFYERAEGGHGLGATPEQKALSDALIYTYLWQRLGGHPVSTGDSEPGYHTPAR